MSTGGTTCLGYLNLGPCAHCGDAPIHISARITILGGADSGTHSYVGSAVDAPTWVWSHGAVVTMVGDPNQSVALATLRDLATA